MDIENAPSASNSKSQRGGPTCVSAERAVGTDSGPPGTSSMASRVTFRPFLFPFRRFDSSVIVRDIVFCTGYMTKAMRSVTNMAQRFNALVLRPFGGERFRYKETAASINSSGISLLT